MIYGTSIQKYHAKRTWSALCNRWFPSKAEAVRGGELALLERAGEICNLQYQVRFILSEKPKVSITIDFAYELDGKKIYEDKKGILTRDFRTKLAWLKQLKKIEVLLS